MVSSFGPQTLLFILQILCKINMIHSVGGKDAAFSTGVFLFERMLESIIIARLAFLLF